MEAAGMMNTLPVAVVRGISDWVDAEKNDIEQEYAAVTIAVVAKELLACLDGSHSISCKYHILTMSDTSSHILQTKLKYGTTLE
jgi:hypothetical protein